MFDNRYQVVLADTEESKQIHYRIRYQVFCLDKQFEDPSKFKEESECDHYDGNSVHFLVRDRETGKWMATVRLVIAHPEKLPLQEVCLCSYDRIEGKTELFAEFSRLAIIKNFRHKTITGVKTKGVETSEPEIMLGLIRAASKYCKASGIQHMLFLCKRSLKRVLGKYGLTIKFIGPACQHKGVRYPYWADLENFAFEQLPIIAPKVYEMFSSFCAYYKYSELFESNLLEAA